MRDENPGSAGALARGLALAATLLLAAVALTAAPTAANAAAPTWGISLTHQNPYGEAGTVDPFSKSATAFDRESYFNSYTITVKNASGIATAGGVAVGTPLACEGGPRAAGITYAWLRGGATISGASAVTYTTAAADAGDEIQCEVRAAGPNGTTAALSLPVLVSPYPSTTPPSAGNPTVTGAPNVGQTLTCDAGSWSGGPTFAYQWLRNGYPIAGATGSTYTTVAEDLDTAIQCEVTGTNAGGSVAADTPGEAGEVIVPAVPAVSTEPTISGTASVGETLTCHEGSWSNSPTGYAYQWLRGGGAISGATGSTYTPGSADEGKAIQCQVTASNAAGAATSASTDTVVSPAPSPPPPTPPSGIYVFGFTPAGSFATVPTVGDKLRCLKSFFRYGPWGNSPTSYEYIWLRNGVPIPGAGSGPTTASSDEYTPTSADANHALQCGVIASNESGAAVAISTVFGAAAASTVVAPVVPDASASLPSPASVTVSDRLPAGLALQTSPKAFPSGAGWSCDVPDRRSLSCGRSDALVPGASYPPITFYVHAEEDAPLGTPPSGGVTNAATVYGGGASPPGATASDPTTIAPAVPFGIFSFTTSVTDSEENPFTQAGGHPLGATTTFLFNQSTNSEHKLRNAGGEPKQTEVELPRGFIGNPQAAPKCPLRDFEISGGESTAECPADTIVGFAKLAREVTYAGKVIWEAYPDVKRFKPPEPSPIYNLQPAPGHPAEFGFDAFGRNFVLDGSVRSNGDYGLTVGDAYTPMELSTSAVQVTFCEDGVTETPEELTFGSFKLLEGYVFSCTAPSKFGEGAIPLLTNPTQCTGPAPATTLRVNSWEHPHQYASMSSYVGAASASPAAAGGPESQASPVASSLVTGCNLLSFAPKVEFGPGSAVEGGSTQAGEPTGETFSLKVPQPEEVEKTATPALKDATVTLPAGLTVDPSAAGGLQACTNAQFGLHSTVEPALPAKCPLASQVGKVEVATPLLEKPLTGEAFIGQPECAVCTNADAEDGHLFRLFLQLYSPERGVVVKLVGKVHTNPKTGQLQATFDNQPQLPFSELVLKLKGGARAPLANPEACGSIAANAVLTPWSASGLGGLSGTESIAGTPPATVSAPGVNVSFDGKGGACPATLPFVPSFTAGSQSTAAGASGAFAMTVGRQDREQDLSAVRITMPPGLIGKVAAAERCAEAQANAGTCPAGSRIGTATVGAGAGPDPYYLTGEVYLTGPYKGAPFGLSIAVPTTAGPFTLAGNTGRGVEVVRAAISVNPHTAQVSVASDPVPTVLEGVPLRLRTIHVKIDRPGFMVNPTSCAKQTLTGTITAAQGASVAVSSPFDVGGCAGLPFKPSFAALIHAHHTRKNGEYLHVVVKSGAGQANIARVHVTLPGKLPSRDSTLKLACLAKVYEKNPFDCPGGSFVGKAIARTPVLSKPLRGPAIFVSHGGAAFPDLDVVLKGEGVTIQLTGHTNIHHGFTTSTFVGVPDVPVSRFDLILPQGPHSALAAVGNLCRGHLQMPTTITGHNGVVVHQKTKVLVARCKSEIQVRKTHVHGGKATIILHVPTAGELTANGKGIRKTSKRISKHGGRMGITVHLKRHFRRKLHHHRHKNHMKVRVHLRFKPTHGNTITSHVKLRFG